LKLDESCISNSKIEISNWRYGDSLRILKQGIRRLSLYLGSLLLKETHHVKIWRELE